MNGPDLFSISTGISLLPFYWRTVVKPYIWQALILCSLMLLGAMLDMATVGLSVPLFNAVTNATGFQDNKVIVSITGMMKFIGVPLSTNTVIVVLLVIGSALFVVRSALSLFQQYCTARIAHKLRRKTKFALFESSLRSQYEEQLKRGRGAILADINNPSGAMYAAILSLAGLFTGVFNGLFLLGLMVYLSWWAALMVGILAIGGVQVLRRILDQRAYSCGRVISQLGRDLAKLEVDSIDGLKVVKAHVLESKMVEKQQSLLEAEARPMLQVVIFRNGPMFINEVAASLIVLGLGAMTFLAPSMGLHFSTLVAFLLAIRKVSPAMASINAASVELNRVKPDLEVFDEILHLMPPEKHGQQSVERVEELRLADISFYYVSRPEERVLKSVDLVMKRGSVTAIVGPTGSGKSTIANLFVGLLTPRLGTISVNGVDLQQLSMSAWRRKVGYVCQDTFLFNATLRENIALWDETVSQADVEWAAGVAQLHEFVMTLPEGYDTVVGDRGLRLSGGQCQRVAIARAILRHPEVLIFDEATSALDNLTERAVYEAISALRKDAIVIVIAHRLSTIKGADQIAVLRSGRVIELGTHESLLNRGGAYADLYEGEDNGRAEGPAALESR